jgi:hypothetical protein
MHCRAFAVCLVLGSVFIPSPAEAVATSGFGAGEVLRSTDASPQVERHAG